MSDELLKLTKYVNTATDLAEHVKKDLKAGGEISDITVLRLAAFIDAGQAIVDMVNFLNNESAKIQN